jgi:ParB-like nuclease family protein
MLGRKTGGRVKGVSKNKPKVTTSVDTNVVSSVVTAGGAAARPAPNISPLAGARAREAPDSGFPKYRIARVDSLIPSERNARIHTRESVDALARQIGEVGWTNPILVAGKRNNILAGHRRRLAAMQRKMEFVPVIDIGHLNAKQRRAYIIWDNKSTIDGDWDEELLRLELGELRDEGFDISLTGFDADELSALFDDPEPPAQPPKRTTVKSVECPNCHHAFAP